MTLQLQQRHDLLGMNSRQVAAFVQQHMSDNPALEVIAESISKSAGEMLDNLSVAADICVEMIDGDPLIYFPHDITASPQHGLRATDEMGRL